MGKYISGRFDDDTQTRGKFRSISLNLMFWSWHTDKRKVSILQDVPLTHHIEAVRLPSMGVERTVVSNLGLPGPVHVVGHHVQHIQTPMGSTRRERLEERRQKVESERREGLGKSLRTASEDKNGNRIAVE